MKKCKKIMAVALAVLMCFCTLSTVFASAATETQATADAQAYNAIEKDFSAYMNSVSEKQADSMASTLNTTLAALLNKIDLKSVVYTDTVATTIIRTIAGLLKTNITNSVYGNGIRTEYPDAYEYLFNTCEGKWENVDNAQVSWGIEPGDRDAFIKVISYGTSNFGTAIFMASAIFGLYDSALVPLIESLHVGKLDTLNEVLVSVSAASNQGVGMMDYILNKVCDAIDMLADNPINYICDVLPDFAKNYPAAANAISVSVGSLGFGSMDLPDFNGIISAVGENFGITLDEIDVDVLVSMGTASVSESGMAGGYRMQINGIRPVVFMALAGYVKETLANEDNQVAFTKILVDQAGIKYETFETMVNAAKEDDCLLFVSTMLEAVEQATSNNGSGAVVSGLAGFLAKLMKIVLMIRDFFRDLASRIVISI